MAHAHPHRPHGSLAEYPGWSLLRLSAAARLGMALAIIAALWIATWAVIS